MKICDACGEKWEDDFFCLDCSDQLYTEEEEVPNIHWCGAPDEEEYVLEDVTYSTGDICKNCCTCQFRGMQKQDNAEAVKTAANSERPFPQILMSDR